MKMKHTTLAFVLAAVITLAFVLATDMVAGCDTTQKAWQTTTTVSPIGQQQYTVGWTIQSTGDDGKDILTTPNVTVSAGTEGVIRVCGANEENGVFCTALVNKTATRLEVITTVTIKENGKTVLNTLQKTAVNQ
jgi:hypothetical protein